PEHSTTAKAMTGRTARASVPPPHGPRMCQRTKISEASAAGVSAAVARRRRPLARLLAPRHQERDRHAAPAGVAVRLDLSLELRRRLCRSLRQVVLHAAVVVV